MPAMTPNALRKVGDETERLHKQLWLDGAAVAEKTRAGLPRWSLPDYFSSL